MIRKRRLKGTESKKQTAPGGKTKRIRPARIFIYALALAALGGGGYLLYDHLRRKKSSDSADDTADTILSVDSTSKGTSAPKASTRVKGNDDFPLKKGSRGTRVTQLQQALIKKGATLKADGKFGAATMSALKAAGYSDTVDEKVFNTITGIDASTLRIVFNPAELAKELYSAASRRDEQEVLDVLRQIKTVSDYSSVNEYYKKQSLISKTIVTHLLEYAFKEDEASAVLIRNEFKRIGLRVNEAGVWSLQGIQLYKDLITIRTTVVTDSMNQKIPVSRNTILGDEVKIENGMTWFRSVDRSLLKVPTQDVKYTTT